MLSRAWSEDRVVGVGSRSEGRSCAEPRASGALPIFWRSVSNDPSRSQSPTYLTSTIPHQRRVNLPSCKEPWIDRVHHLLEFLQSNIEISRWLHLNFACIPPQLHRRDINSQKSSPRLPAVLPFSAIEPVRTRIAS